MPRLFITCPVSGKPIDTGVFATRSALEREPLAGRAWCPTCGRTHVWTSDHAFEMREAGSRRNRTAFAN